MSTDLVRVPFNGGTLVAAVVNGEPHVSVRHVCDALGIDTRSQLRKLASRSWASVVKMTMQLPGDTQSREFAVVDRRTLTMWLATISVNAVAEDAREVLAAYQEEAADALDAYFNRGGVAVRTTGDLSSIDIIRAMVDQLEANQRAAELAQQTADEARAIASGTAARLDAIEGQHDCLAALGYARIVGMADTSAQRLQRLGVAASRIAREESVPAVKLPSQIYGHVNGYPRWVWDRAAEALAVRA